MTKAKEGDWGPKYQKHHDFAEVMVAAKIWKMKDLIHQYAVLMEHMRFHDEIAGKYQRHIESANNAARALVNADDRLGELKLLAANGNQFAIISLKGLASHRRAVAKSSGREGAKERHARTKQLREWAVQRYKAKIWPSANKAAHELKAEILAHGRTIGATLSEENAQRTLAEWFRKAGK